MQNRYSVSWQTATGSGDAAYDDLSDAEIRFDEAVKNPRYFNVTLYDNADPDNPVEIKSAKVG